MFIDVANITLSSGRGGKGAVSFHREKYVAAGGPDGGDGGRGGHIYIQADDNLSTLMDFRYKRKYIAANGEDGGTRSCSGRSGADLTIRVPRGTLIKDKNTERLLYDASDSEPFLLARGGRGGWGNKRFATPTRQAPRFAKSGHDGISLEVTLELKLLADVGLVGFPNAGKSSLLTVISAARPKVADYPFTTLSPHLGVVQVDDVSFVVADLPGLIEGAAQGAGLGYDFLRHIERCRLLIHVVDLSPPNDAVYSYDTINAEMAVFSPELVKRPQIVAANKADIWEDDTAYQALVKRAAPRKVFAISTATRQGVDDLVNAVAAELAALPPIQVYQPEMTLEPETPKEREFKIKRDDSATWVIEGDWLRRIMRDINFGDHEQRQYFDRLLRKAGVFDMLEARGISEGDTVRIFDLEFEYVP